MQLEANTMQVSLVLPAHNEVIRIEEAVKQTAKALKEITSTFEIIIAEDGSNDGTDKISKELAMKHSYIRHLPSEFRLGKGGALSRAFKSTNGDILCFIDVDLATDMIHLKELIYSISVEGYDFSIGSRMIPGSDTKRSLKRDVASKGFKFLVRTVLRSNIYDHQCGFKAFKRESLLNLLDRVEDKSWFWDTELLVLAQHHGYKVKEFPVTWREGNATKVDLKNDIFYMGFRIFHLRWHLNKYFKMNGGKPCEVVIESKQI
jgi:glycosyltransferase AglD